MFRRSEDRKDLRLNMNQQKPQKRPLFSSNVKLFNFLDSFESIVNMGSFLINFPFAFLFGVEEWREGGKERDKENEKARIIDTGLSHFHISHRCGRANLFSPKTNRGFVTADIHTECLPRTFFLLLSLVFGCQ